MWQVRFYCRTALNYNGKELRPGEEWVPAGLLNDKKIMYGSQMRPEYSKVVRRRKSAPKK